MKYDEIDDALDITPTEVKSEKIVKKEPEVTADTPISDIL